MTAIYELVLFNQKVYYICDEVSSTPVRMLRPMDPSLHVDALDVTLVEGLIPIQFGRRGEATETLYQ